MAKTFYPKMVTINNDLTTNTLGMKDTTTYSEAFQASMDLFEKFPNMWGMVIISNNNTLIPLKRSTYENWLKHPSSKGKLGSRFSY